MVVVCKVVLRVSWFFPLVGNEVKAAKKFVDFECPEL
jgi:hypothetical protein